MRRFTLSLLLVVNCNSYSFEFGQASSAGGDGGTAGTGASAAAGGEGGEGGTGGVDPLLEGAPQADVAVAAHTVDIFGKDGNRFWFAVRPEQVELMNQKDGGGFGDIYSPGAGADDATFVDHLLVTSAEEQPHTANYGKVEVKVIGESTFRPWTPESIPNLRVDMDQFTDGLEVGGVEHLRFNNGLVGSIFRELIAFEVYRGLGYPAPRASFAWVGSNVWGPNVQIPYTLAEVYKTDFCTANSELLGGGCPNMFEFVGDIPFTDFDDPNNCQIGSCDGTRLEELGTIISSTPPGAGFKAATEAYLDWNSVHRFQCLSWILWTGDDAFHNTNNVVLLEKEDGRYIYLPYSVDISGGQEWYQNTPLYGMNSVAFGCQADPECWADTIATCEDTIADFIALDPAALVDSVHERLVAQDMLRPGDEERYATIRNWYVQRTLDLLPELDQYRGVPCLDPNVKCGDAGECIPVFECNPVCEGADIPCGPVCQQECFECPFPFSWCGDGSCRGQCF